MAELMSISIKASGFDQLLKQASMPLTMSQSQAIASRVYFEAENTLIKHIEQDVYDRYTPKMYVRRSEHPGYGPALTDMEANVWKRPDATIDLETNAITVKLNYMPSGEHRGKFGDFYNEEELKDLRKKASDPIKPPKMQVDGNTLIKRIETGEGYDWDFDMPRPFWEKFVDEMIEGGGFERALTSALIEQGFEILATDPAVREPDDGNY